MVTIGEGVQRLQSAYSKGMPSKDIRLTARHIYSNLLTGRATLLTQQSNKNQKINNTCYSLLSFVELEKASVHEVSFAPAGCTVLKSKNKLPRLISGIDSMLFKSIVSLDGSLSFDLKEFETIKYTKGSKFTSKKGKAYLRNGYLYVVNSSLKLKGISTEGLFYDPIEVMDFNIASGLCDNCACISAYDIEFPIDGNLFRTVIDIAYNETVLKFTQMSEDKKPNASDDNFVRGTAYKTNNLQTDDGNG